MIQEPILFTAKNGHLFEIRTPREGEAQRSLDLMIEVAVHCPYILSTSENFRAKTLESQLKWFQESALSDTSIILAVYHEGCMLGFCNGSSYKDVKRKHRAALGVSLHPDIRGIGIGYKLMEVLISNMRKFSGIKIIELGVMMNNKPALRMYEKLGFKSAGLFPKAYILPSGEVSDGLTMCIEVE